MNQSIFRVGLFSILSLTSTHSQIFENIAPRKPVQDEIPTQTLTLEENPLLVADRTVILPSLKGIIFRGSVQDVVRVSPRDSGVTIVQDSALMRQPEFLSIAESHIGKPVSLRSLSVLRRDLILYCRKQDRPVVDVILPEQDITNGTIQLVMIEAVLGETKIVGNKHFSDSYLAKNLTTKHGAKIVGGRLLWDTNWLNRNPFLHVQSVFSPGLDVNSADVILKVEDELPYRAYVGYENTGNDLSGRSRYLLGFNAGNLFDRGHTFDYQLTVGDELADFGAHSLSYQIPFEWKGALRFYAAYVDTNSVSGPFDISGESIQAGVRYKQYLQEDQWSSHALYGGLNWKSSNNGLVFGLIPASQNNAQALQLETGYEFNYKTKYSWLNIDLGFVYAPGGIVSQADDSDYEAIRDGAESQYGYFKFDVDYLRKLPKGFSYRGDLRGQLSTGQLLASEQLTLGGYSSVRGYDEREFDQTDTGFVIRNDFKAPPIYFSIAPDTKASLQFLLFTDYAVATASGGEIVRDDGSTKDITQMWSVGVGARMTVTDHFSFWIDYGRRLLEEGSNDNGRVHLGAILSF